MGGQTRTVWSFCTTRLLLRIQLPGEPTPFRASIDCYLGVRGHADSSFNKCHNEYSTQREIFQGVQPLCVFELGLPTSMLMIRLEQVFQGNVHTILP